MIKVDLEKIKAAHPIKEVAEQLGLWVRGNSGKCFNHEDNHPSLVYMTDNNRFECKACSIKGDVIDLVMKVKGIPFKEAVEFLEPGLLANFTNHKFETAEEYLKSRLLSPETLQKFGIRIENNKVVIPLPTGNKYRVFGGDSKFTQDKGTESTIFKTTTGAKEVVLCEGELDAIKVFQETNCSSWSGTGGAGTFREEWKNDFEEVEKIFICYDNDESGRIGTEKVISILGDKRCYTVTLPDYVKDATEFFQMGGTKDQFIDLLENAKPAKHSILNFLDEMESSLFVIPSGFEFIDNKVKFEAGNAYLIGGCEKSGKSAFCMNIASNLLIKGFTISYANTEFTQSEFINRMCGIYLKTPYSDISPEQRKEYATKFQNNLLYSGIGQDLIIFEVLHEKILRHVAEGVKIVFFDNVTTFSNNPPPNTDGWKEQARVMNELKDLAKEKNIVVFVVLHTKDIPIERTITSKVKDIIEENNPSKIFDDTVVVMAKPTNANLYGGLRIASQFSGTILIWRPFLKFSDPYFNQATQIILESFRNAPSGVGYEVIFKGEIPTFEVPISTIAEEIFSNGN